jgi:two-component system LytT family response regulator
MDRIALPTKDGFEYVHAMEIICMQASGNYSLVTLTSNKSKKTIHIFRSLKSLEVLLADKGFVRIHNEYLINLYHLMRYDKGDGGVVEMSDGKKIEVSRVRKKKFLRAVGGMRD